MIYDEVIGVSPNPVEIWIQTPTYTRREKATEGEGGDLVMRLRAKDPRGGRRGTGRGACRRVSLTVPKMYKLDLEKAEEPENQIANICWIIIIYFCFTDCAKAFVWITTNCGTFLMRWEYQTTLPAS